MKENIIISCLAVLILALGITLIYEPNDKEIYTSQNSEIISENSLAMMYETEAGSGEYQISSDTSWPQDGYVFNETLSKCENGSTLTWDEASKKVTLNASISDKCYVYFDKKILTFADTCTEGTLACEIAKLYTVDGANNLYYHDGSGTYGAQEAGDNSYRYAGANPNNYVCFGSDAATCPNDNLYRIIGVFGNQVKLIKHDYATTSLLGTNGAYSQTYEEWGMDNTYKGSIDGSLIGVYYWNNSTNTNTWSESNLNTVNLNTNYLNNIGSKWSSLIATTNWKVGGNSWANIGTATPKTAYQNEIVNSVEATTYSAKIGLMYVSDYGYAASPAAWTLNMYGYNNSTATSNNWMYMGLYEWPISRDSDDTNFAFVVDNTGNVSLSGVRVSVYGVRPSFYLQPWVLYSNGDGSKENPYRISAPENLISFTVDDVIYYAEKGMTWEEWVNTDYNVDNFYIDMSSVCAVMSLENVKSTDVIGENATYVRSRFRCSLIAG